MRSTILRIIVLGVAAGTLAAQNAQEAGYIEYFEGGLRLISSDEILDEFDIGFGEPVHLDQTLETGPDGRATVDLTGGVTARIDVGPNTAYTFNEETSSGGSSGSVQLIHGKIGVVVDSLGREDRFQVQSRNSVMGVRGTQFDVVTAADGSLLVGVREGRVETASGQRSVSIGVGEIAEVVPGGGLSTSLVPVDRLDDYYRIWVELRNEVFARDPGFFLAQYLREFDSARARFEPAAREFLEVMSDRAEREGPGTMGSSPAPSGSNLGNVLNRTGQAPATMRVRSALPLFEERYSVLADLLQMITENDVRGLSTENRQRLRTFERTRAQHLRLLAAVHAELARSGRFELQFPGN
ncbi:MAG: FecR domain-containing protein [Spirochaetota bacterium]